MCADAMSRPTDPKFTERFNEHYARTLRSWRERFEGGWERLQPLGYDERFRRLWRFYLSTSEAGFLEKRVRDVQMLFAKPRWRSSQARESEPAVATAVG